jgi:alpha-glucosidase
MKALTLLLTLASATFAQLTPTPNGIQARTTTEIISITALRDDVLRIRLGRNGRLPEDASWAVLPAARSATLTVTPTATGFTTAKLRLALDPQTLQLTISDLAGNILSADVPTRPLEFHGDSFRFYKQMPEDEHYFGLGDKTGPLDRRGSAFTLWNTDAFGFQESTDPIYKAIPFFIGFRAGKSYGLLFDNTWRSSFDFGKEVRDALSFSAEGGPIDYYFFYGPEPKQVVQTYAWLTGTTPLPPLWSLGFQQSRYSYETEARVRQIANRLRADKIPADAIYLDIDYQKKNRPFTVDEEKFPHFQKMVADLKAENFHTILITDLHIAKLPNADYTPYDTGEKGDHFVKNPDGSEFTGIVWPGPSVFPDFTRKASRDWWGTLYKNFYSQGVAGFWNDMNEPAVFETPTKTMPLDVQDRIDEPGFATRTTTQREIHNIFGMQNSRGTYEGLLKLNPDQRPFVLTRASYAGGQRYSATWTGDNSSTWNHLRMSIPMLLNLGLSGFSMAGDDIGGFAGSPGMDLLTKWIEVGAFNPIFRDHTEKGSNDQEPWAGGAQQEAIRRRFIEERYRLLPYIYTLAEETSRTGIPMMRPLFLEFPAATGDKHPLDNDATGQFMWGPDLLIAQPAYPDEVQPYSAILPPGVWFDYWTGRRVAGEKGMAAAVSTGTTAGLNTVTQVRIKPALAELPVFVRGGSIFARQPLVQSTAEKPQGPLELRVYPADNCQGSVYQDDGISFAYTRGAYRRQAFSCQQQSGVVSLHFNPSEGTFTPWWSRVEVVIFGWTSAKVSITLNEKPITASQFDAPHGALHILIPDQPQGGELRVIAK